MGKVATTEMNKPKKKKGRPAKNPQINQDSTNLRSTRRNPNSFNSPPSLPEFDDDDERKEKKVKLVVRLPQSGLNRRHSQDYDSGSDSDPESEDRGSYAKKRKINAADHGSDDDVPIQANRGAKVSDSPIIGSPLESGPTPLPERKMLVFILDRLQKKDTYGVFSEPVDPNELPDYFETIEQPMDFGTVRKKLNSGAYKCLDELEADVLLICANAMQYNAPDTIYYRQARTIQELAKRDFENLKHEGDDGEPQPKVVRRGRPPGIKSQKKSMESSPVDRVTPERSSGATLATGEDRTAGAYNLRKAPAINRFRSNDPYMSSNRSRNGENYSEWLADWNDEFPASVIRADMKHTKRQFTVDETRRESYKNFQPPPSSGNSPVLSHFTGDVKRLVPVGLQEPLSYARSLAKFAATLGPLAWRYASKKIEMTLPPGMQYGPGWVGDKGTPPPHQQQLSSFSSEKDKSSNTTTFTPSTSDPSSIIAPAHPSEAMVEAVKKLNSSNEQVVSLKTPFPQQKPRNGFSGLVGYDLSASAGTSSQQPKDGEIWSFGKSTWPAQQKRAVSVPPDLNVRVPVGSPSTVQIGSPKQPDLALQL